MRNVVSLNGDAVGVAVWPSVKVALTGNVQLEDIVAGAQLRSLSLLEETLIMTWDSRPNRAPMACALLSVGKFSKETETTYVSNVEVTRDEDGHKEQPRVDLGQARGGRHVLERRRGADVRFLV